MKEFGALKDGTKWKRKNSKDAAALTDLMALYYGQPEFTEKERGIDSHFYD